jgi:hypothetical protein
MGHLHPGEPAAAFLRVPVWLTVGLLRYLRLRLWRYTRRTVPQSPAATSAAVASLVAARHTPT